MIKTKIFDTIKCDTVMCNDNAVFKLETNSFKGNTFLCLKCYNDLKILFKKDIKTNVK